MLRNKHHFKKSGAELQALQDDLKKQQQNKKANLDKEKNEQEDSSERHDSKASQRSEYS